MKIDEQMRVRGVNWIGEGIFELVLERAEWLTFLPGDCLALFAADGRVSRPYSIASGKDEGEVRFVIRKMSDGVVSPYLAERKEGDVVRVSPPFGWFRPGECREERPFMALATGTGIAPFLSYLRSYPNHPPSALWYGVREGQDVIDPGIKGGGCEVRIAVSREQVEGLHHGRITDWLEELPRGGDTDYYLCGLDTMIDEVTVHLEQRGVPIYRIHRECFFNAS